MTHPQSPTEALLPCPFCGAELDAQWNRPNPKARCRTEGCKGRQLPVLNLDVLEDITAWNTRLPAASEAMNAQTPSGTPSWLNGGADAVAMAKQDGLLDEEIPASEAGTVPSRKQSVVIRAHKVGRDAQIGLLTSQEAANKLAQLEAEEAAPSDAPAQQEPRRGALVKPEDVHPEQVLSLISAVEGECNGLALSERQARLILGCVLSAPAAQGDERAALLAIVDTAKDGANTGDRHARGVEIARAALSRQPSAGDAFPPECTDLRYHGEFRRGWNSCLAEAYKLRAQRAAEGDA